jgi:hypothetical protein
MVPSGRCIQRKVGELTEPQAIFVAKRIAESVPQVPDWTTIKPGDGFAALVKTVVKAALSDPAYPAAGNASERWSYELRAKVAAAAAADKERDRTRVTIDQEDF